MTFYKEIIRRLESSVFLFINHSRGGNSPNQRTIPVSFILRNRCLSWLTNGNYFIVPLRVNVLATCLWSYYYKIWIRKNSRERRFSRKARVLRSSQRLLKISETHSKHGLYDQCYIRCVAQGVARKFSLLFY